MKNKERIALFDQEFATFYNALREKYEVELVITEDRKISMQPIGGSPWNIETALARSPEKNAEYKKKLMEDWLEQEWITLMECDKCKCSTTETQEVYFQSDIPQRGPPLITKQNWCIPCYEKINSALVQLT